ncbi:MAG: cobalamin biosynthesis protein CobD [Candidatus Lambdaproteobacteria bacterium RIFOXYD2_FULL_50_16]|uniref:Cobalamin biosynthesis protein CobD n=1 Tax=Candidatus Lambdaproteobacteria bacterium RIFOXYD2_FULL_50_16 TaxID=1817772 RepID=A0A1F6GAX5_9PROT|nr:MAG: cobalamin biosynthesis protein CobD [Candidatus Lambdaproteobacteria bacterium RIFOXYD2_FULL_50_16]
MAIILGLILDRILGDPVYRFHPVRLLGSWALFVESRLRAYEYTGSLAGLVQLLSVLPWVLGLLLLEAFLRGPYYLAFEVYLFYSLIAWGDLRRHGVRLYQALQAGDLCLAQNRAQMLVSRDVSQMDSGAAARAGIESIAENWVDGFLAPLLFFHLFGLPGLLIFKWVSTLDSMVGYKNPKYLAWGGWAARLDDLFVFIPARLSWLLLGFTALLLPKYQGWAGIRLGFSQHHLLPSPNSGWPEATVAGALGVRLLGPVYREGQPHDSPWIGLPEAPEAGQEHLKQTLWLAEGAWALVLIFETILNWPGLVRWFTLAFGADLI